MRRSKDKRKQEREAKKLYPFLWTEFDSIAFLNETRQEDERKRREEELRRLRALKRQEIEKKLHEIQEIGGLDKDLMSKINLDEDWDPAKYDAEMESLFNDDYYGEDEENPDVKPDLHLEEILDEDELPEEVKKEMEVEEKEEEEEEEGEEDSEHEKGSDEELLDEENENESEKRTPEENEELKKHREEAEKLVDELYNLDYEDMIGDTPVRFHYTKVRPLSYGLSTDEILQADDSELRKFVSIKKLAPYRDHEWRITKNKVGKFKALLKKQLKREEQEAKENRKKEKKQRKKEKKEAERRMKEQEKKATVEKKNRRSKKNKNAKKSDEAKASSSSSSKSKESKYSVCNKHSKTQCP